MRSSFAGASARLPATLLLHAGRTSAAEKTTPTMKPLAGDELENILSICGLKIITARVICKFSKRREAYSHGVLVEIRVERFAKRHVDVLQVHDPMAAAGFDITEILVFLGKVPGDQEAV